MQWQFKTEYEEIQLIMEIFGVGILEVVLILVIAVIVLGPEGMVKSAQTIGKFMRKVIKSPIWAQLMDTQRELRDMPTRLVREAGLEEDIKELKKTQQELRNIDIKATAAKAAQSLVSEPTIAPPSVAEPVEARQAQGAGSVDTDFVEAPVADNSLAEPVEARQAQGAGSADAGPVEAPVADNSLAEPVEARQAQGVGSADAEPVEAPDARPDEAPPEQEQSE